MQPILAFLAFLVWPGRAAELQKSLRAGANRTYLETPLGRAGPEKFRKFGPLARSRHCSNRILKSNDTLTDHLSGHRFLIIGKHLIQYIG